MKERVQDAIADVHQALQQDAKDVTTTVRKVVLDCSWFGRAELASTDVNEFELNCSKDFAFEWLYLKMLISKGECVEKSIKEIVTLLSSLAKMLPTMLMQPEQFDSTLKSLLALQHMLQQILSCHPVMDTDYLLREAIPVRFVWYASRATSLSSLSQRFELYAPIPPFLTCEPGY